MILSLPGLFLQDLDSGVLGDTGTHGVSHTVDGLDALGQDLFDSPCTSNSNLPHGSYSLPSPGGPMLTQQNRSYGPGSVGSQPPPSPAHSVPQSPMGGHTPSVPPSPYAHPMQSPASVPPPPSPAQHQFSVPSPAQPMSPVTHLQMKSPASHPPPQSPANILYAKSPAPHIPPQSPSNQNLRCSTTPGPPVLSPQPMPAPQSHVTTNSIFLSAPSPSGPIFSGSSLVSGTVLTSNQLGMQPIQLHPSGNIVSGAQPMFQFQIQPNVSMQSLATSSQSTKIQPVASQTIPITPNKGKQPQLLPKPSGSISNSPQSVAPRPIGAKPGGPATSAMTMTSPSTSNQQQPLIINQTGLISNVQQGQGQVFMGQMMASAGAGNAPLLIQQPQGNMMILRPSAPTMQSVQTAPTLVPIQNGMGGQIFVQQAPQQTGIMPNVKLITPQGRMQMQHIQTPSGPKLIAVPIGQTLIQGPNGQILTQGQNIITNNTSGGMQINANGQIQFQAAPNMALSSAPMFTTTSQAYTLQATQASSQPQIIYSSPSFVSSSSTSTGGVTTVMSSLQPINSLNSVNSSNLITSQSVIQTNQSLDTTAHPAMQVPVSPTKKKKSKKKKKDEDPPLKSQGTVDLGALMKDVGLDFGEDFGFGLDQHNSNNVDLNESNQNLNNSLNSSQGSSSSDLENDIGNISIPAPPVIQPPEQVPVSVPQISFAQIPQPQFAAPQLATSQIGTQQIVSNTPLQGMRLANPIVNPQINSNTAQSLQLVQGPDGNFILQTNPAQGILGGQPVEVNTGSTVNTASSQIPQQATTTTAITSQAPKSSPRAPARSRTAADPNRTPLFEDETLPSGWHRKVSQRKSGASAGRYEVFIIGPTGKRFRSRNELKSFFEKTGETKLNPDDFDFSTFGRNNPKVTIFSLCIISSKVYFMFKF